MVRLAPDRLRAYVVSYMGFDTRQVQGGPKLSLPAATATLVLGWGDPLTVHAGRGEEPGASAWHGLLAGLHTAPVVSGYSGAAHAVMVDFTPLGAYRFLGIPLHHLTDVLVDPDEILGSGWSNRLAGRLAAAEDWAGCWAVLDNALSRRFADGPVPSAVVAHAWKHLRTSNGTITMRELAQSTGCGNRRFQMIFREQIGLPAKTAARILRFQRALTLSTTEAESFAHTAAQCGYHDQAHLTATSARSPTSPPPSSAH